MRLFFLFLLTAVFFLTCIPCIGAAEPSTVVHEDEIETLFDAYVTENDLNPDLISVAYEYTATGERWYHLEDRWYYSASLYKVPLMMLLTEREYLGELTKDTEINGMTLEAIEEEVLVNSNNPVAYSTLLSIAQPDVCRRLFCKYSDLPEEYYTWDFYGGTLNGIREKLPYLEALGITVIYLNPIFEAASNHRYDTANYLKIDPMLGTEDDFKALCQDASARGISIILDGVFNHVGADSLYFNKYGNYGSEGAAQPGASAYDTWFTFRGDGSYCSWWGVDDLPDVNEDSPDFRELICGHDGVIRKWLRLGARGWRLDVADELSTSPTSSPTTSSQRSRRRPWPRSPTPS